MTFSGLNDLILLLKEEVEQIHLKQTSDLLDHALNLCLANHDALSNSSSSRQKPCTDRN